MRLIDGDGVNLTLFERGQIDKRFKWGETIRYTPSEVQQIINEDMPTVDAVEVVRCRECKHAKQTNDGYYACVWSAVLTGAGWFCCHGGRKGGDE